MQTHSSARWLISAVVLAHGLSVKPVRAEGPVSGSEERDLSYEKAHALFLEGRRLLAQGETLEACEHFEQSLAIEDAVGTKFNLASCWEKLGKTASAQELYTEVVKTTLSLGQAQRAQVASERVAALEPRLSRLVIEVESPVEGLTVERNREPLPRERWGKALAVDPAVYELRASAPGKQPWTRHVSVAARRSLVLVSIPPLADFPEARAEPTEEPEIEARTARSTESPEPEHTWRRPALFGLTSVALGGIAAGTVFSLKYRAANDRAEGICTTTPKDCPAADIVSHAEYAREARAARNGAYISFGIGAAALAGAVITYLGVPVYRSEGVRVSARPISVGNGVIGISADGRF